MPKEGAANFFKLEEDIICSVCLSELNEPVSIACGHTFCTNCISDYWATPQVLGYRCPECRKICPKDQLIPVHRLRNLVTKVQLVVKEEQSRETPACAVQLVYTDGAGHLQLDEAALESCFLRSEISDYPVCLICVIGEKRRGKSFLMNFILRVLHCQEKGEPLSLGQDDELLQGFEWRAGADSITKGVWIWNRPFILDHNGQKTVVYVLDTEGSLDIEGDKETCIKLSALSMVLSSYLIFNVNSSLKTTELEYLELYLHIAELTGKSFSLQYLQHLDILIRDWHDYEKCEKEDARAYLTSVQETLRKSVKNPLVLNTLRSPSVSCSLLPHPGKRLLRSVEGKLTDMDEDFRNHLTKYINDLVIGIWRHMKTDVNEEKITSAELARILKEFVILLQEEQYSFASPLEMFFSYENHKKMKEFKKKFLEALDNLAPMTSSPFKLVRVLPKQMRANVSEAASGLLQDFEDSLSGNYDQAKNKILDEMKLFMQQEQEAFCANYSKRFIKCAVGIGGLAGASLLSLVGGVAGAAIAGTILAAEGAVLAGSTAAAVAGGALGGSVTMGAIGGGVGAGVGRVIGHIEKKNEQKPDEGNNNEGASQDKEQLVKPQE
ncbi:RING finger protein 112 isoform X2 [Bombina bombina]|nr:RING finger protein 112 isoform X2 [Bombina bombina]XP_053551138.1 RING finger protein 112 isoform X2 [Bombina bombina]XP_053551139.1 RING finger protein 112 isoform X2 [Bombina bombina]